MENLSNLEQAVLEASFSVLMDNMEIATLPNGKKGYSLKENSFICFPGMLSGTLDKLKEKIDSQKTKVV